MMMRSAVWIHSTVGLTLLAGLSLGLVGSAQAQAPKKETEEVGILAADPLRGQDNSRYNDLRSGREAIEPADKPLLAKAARWYVYRLTRPEFRNGTVDEGKSKMSQIANDAIRQVPAYDPKKSFDPQDPVQVNQKAFALTFSKYLRAELEKVMGTSWPITRINAAMVLDHLAKAGDEEVADVLVKIVQDPKEIDAVKLYALRGLKNLFALGNMQPPIPIKDKEREARCIQALIQFLDRPANLGENPSLAEIDGFRWVRREAVSALGVTRRPWLLDANGKSVGTPTAWELLRVCCQNDINPLPSLSEQIEAAVGVCQLKARQAPNYQIDYAAHYLGWFVRDFAMDYVAEKSRKTQAWKYQAVRLRQALQTLQEEARSIARDDRPAADYVNSVVGKFDPILEAIERQNTPDTSDLKTWLQQHTPQGKTSLFKNDMGKYAIKPPPEQAG